MAEIVIAQNDRIKQVVTVGGELTLPYDFEIFQSNQLTVLENDGTTTRTMVEGVDYSVGGVGQAGGGSITLDTTVFPTGAPVAYVYTLFGDVKIERLSDFSALAKIPSSTMNIELDTLVLIAQQLRRDLDFSMRAPEEDGPIDMVLPNIADRANKAQHYDGGGLPLMVEPTDASGTAVTSAGSPTSRQLATRFAEFPNVRDFGAVLNGVADDLAAFQAALAAHDTIWMDEGTALLSARLSMGASQKILGLHNRKSIIKLGAAAADIYFSETGCQLHDLEVDANYVADYCVRTNPATDAQRGDHFVVNCRLSQAEKACMVIEQDSDGTKIINSTLRRPGARDANGLPTTYDAHCLITRSEARCINTFLAGSTGYNLVVERRRFSMIGGRCNFGWEGNVLVRETANGLESPQSVGLSLVATFLENAGIANSGATSVNNRTSQTVLADGPSVRVHLSNNHKITVAKSEYGLCAINGAEIHSQGSPVVSGTWDGANRVSRLFSTPHRLESHSVALAAGGASTDISVTARSFFRPGDEITIADIGAAGADLETSIVSISADGKSWVLNDAWSTAGSNKKIEMRPRGVRALSLTGTMDKDAVDPVQANILELSATPSGDDVLNRYEKVRVAGAGAASADLDTHVLDAGDTSTVKLADDALTDVAGAVVSRLGQGVGRIWFDDLSGMRGVLTGVNAAGDPVTEWQGLTLAGPRDVVEGLSIVPRHMRLWRTVLDGNRLNSEVASNESSLRGTSSEETTGFLTGVNSRKFTGDGATASTNLVDFDVDVTGLQGCWVMAVMTYKREKTDAGEIQANTRIEISGAGLAVAGIASAEADEDVPAGGAGAQGPWRTSQAFAYVQDETIALTVKCILDRSSNTSNDVLYIDRVDIYTVNAPQVLEQKDRLPPALLVGVKASVNFASVASGAVSAEEVVTVTGAAVGDLVLAVTHDQVTNDEIILSGQVTAANTVSVFLKNNAAGAVDLASGTLTVIVAKV